MKADPRQIALLGPPGSGKGAQAARLARTFGVPHLAAGEMFRAAMSAGTEAGLRARAFVERGELVPIEAAIAVVEERLCAPDAAPGFIFEGFPRTIEQAHALDALLLRLGRRLARCIALELDDDTLVARLRARMVKPSDASEEMIRRQLATFRDRARPVIEHYRQRGRLAEIDGAGTIDEVAARIAATL